MSRKLNQSDVLVIETLLEATQKNKIDWEMRGSILTYPIYVFNRNPSMIYAVIDEGHIGSYISITNPGNEENINKLKESAKINIPFKYYKLVKAIKKYSKEKLMAKRKEEEDARFLSANRMLASAYSDIEALRKELGLDALHEGFNP